MRQKRTFLAHLVVCRLAVDDIVRVSAVDSVPYFERAIHEEIVRRIVLAAAIVIVDAVAGVGGPKPVPIEDEILVDLVCQRVERNLSSVIIVYDRLSVPAVEHPVVTRLANKIHDEVPFEHLAARAAVVKVHLMVREA